MGCSSDLSYPMRRRGLLWDLLLAVAAGLYGYLALVAPGVFGDGLWSVEYVRITGLLGLYHAVWWGPRSVIFLIRSTPAVVLTSSGILCNVDSSWPYRRRRFVAWVDVIGYEVRSLLWADFAVLDVRDQHRVRISPSWFSREDWRSLRRAIAAHLQESQGWVPQLSRRRGAG